MSDRYRPVSETVLADDWGRLTKHVFYYRRRDGTWDRQVREVYDRGHGACCLLHDPLADTVLLTRQFRLPMQVTEQDPFVVEVPAGLLDGAAPADRIRDELMEETGYRGTAIRHVTDLIMSPGSVSEYLACFVGRYDRGDQAGRGGGAPDEGEDIEVIHMPLADALAGVADGTIRDAKTAFLIQHLALSRR
ncbi:NUDIX domain-containing protein [Jannaschia sp. LMIT008]|uniref:NUDIX domain-containing protein n=1 Tax=Jannaschia maritima TaxID=3032585 RepID=UPI002811AB1D|nr:NUDIX domain-containing protein [Jannaschia sp. LMIT008]